MPAPLEEDDLLIVTDLHLSEGRHPETRTFSLNEDFFFDEEFGRFLAYYQDETRWAGRKWHLIINGDFLDFLQVTAYEDVPPELLQDVKRPEYGLGCGEQETVYKLGKIMDGHWQFFESLADFIAAGNIVSISKGNHDVELHYQAVRTAFRDELRAVYEKRLDREADSDKARKLASLNEESIRFLDWFYYEKGLLWVEHGNQYDEVNNFKYWLSPLLPDLPKGDSKHKDDIDLPWGSLFVRYLFNRVETKEPSADNIKPQTKFIGWFLRRHPFQALKFLYGDGRYMLVKMRRAWKPVPPAAYAKREEAHSARLHKLAAEWAIPEAELRFLDTLRARSVLKETPGFCWKLLRGLVCGRLFFPLVTILLLLAVLAIILAVSPLGGALLPHSLQWLFWGSWSRTASGALLVFLGSVIRWLVLVLLISFIALYLQKRAAASKNRNTGASYLARQAREIASKLKVQYVIMGHTHDTDLQPIGQKGGEYFNTGTWTKVFSAAERLIREENELAFVQALRQEDGLKVKLLKWYDAAGAPRLVKLFDQGKTR